MQKFNAALAQLKSSVGRLSAVRVIKIYSFSVSLANQTLVFIVWVGRGVSNLSAARPCVDGPFRTVIARLKILDFLGILGG